MNESNEKDILKLKEEILNIFSSSMTINALSRFKADEFSNISVPAPENESKSMPKSVSDTPIQINVNVDGEKIDNSKKYEKSIIFDKGKQSYNINLKKNNVLQKILNYNSNFITKFNPLNIHQEINQSELFFTKKYGLTERNKVKTKKSKKLVGEMNFVFDNPYSFFTNVGNYYIKNDTTTSNNQNYIKNNTTTSNNQNYIKNDINTATTVNQLNETNNSINAPTTNYLNETNNSINAPVTSVNKQLNQNMFVDGNVKNNTEINNTTPITNIDNNNFLVNDTSNITNQTRTVENNTKDTTKIINNDTNVIDMFKTNNVVLNRQNDNIYNYNMTQLNKPNYEFTKKEQYVTVDKSKGETLSTLKKLTFSQMNQRTVNRIQAKTITQNKENKLLVPAFAGGGEGIVKSTTPIVIGERGTESFQVIPQSNSTPAISSSPTSALRGESAVEFKTNDSGDKISEAIKKDTQNKQSNSEKSLENTKENESKDIVNELKDASKDLTPDKGKRKTSAKPANIKIDNKPLIIESFKRLTIGTTPIWRTKHM
jgi:hypothetical protein